MKQKGNRLILTLLRTINNFPADGNYLSGTYNNIIVVSFLD